MTLEFSIQGNISPLNERSTITLSIDFSSPYQQKLVFRTPLKIEPEQWDIEKQRPLNIYLKKYKKINSKLDELKIRINQYYKGLNRTGKFPSKRTISREIRKTCLEKVTSYPELSLLQFIKLYIETKEDVITSATYKRYRVFMHFIQKFEGFISERLYVETIDSRFIKNFISFGKQENYSENTIYRSIHFIRTILNFAEKKE
ncbi:phage integrase SAM-like domain-containing protein [Chryseobacterium daecheongense]|uniref:phage integrase SAM-like domain-containing protein n=1 Tax=Chryseobacterium daecheongense TaxID=192389 RepID=UPI001FD6C475|nr:phage integrase SAM-like domain-containing protein [Chryseobacterium daecheongense]UOU99888.1 phage integrase SAM-like domain-containing protein [Chryseobacterium daecheongense]